MNGLTLLQFAVDGQTIVDYDRFIEQMYGERVRYMPHGEESLLKVLQGITGGRKKKLIADFEQKFGLPVGQQRDRKYRSGFSCPNPSCKGEGKIVKYGFVDAARSSQRYYCKACGRHFNDCTDTFFHNRKLRSHISAFMQTMLDGLSIRETAAVLNISPTTAHTWRKTILQLIEKNWGRYLEKLHEDSIIETSSSEFKSSRKGLPKISTVPAAIQIVKFNCDRLDRYDVSLDSADFLQSNKPLKRNIATACADDQSRRDNSIRSPADLLLLHNRNIKLIGERFATAYRRMRGVAQPYLALYARWQCLLAYLDKFTRKDRLRFLQTMCL